MIRKLLNGDIDRVADIWLKTNLKAHYFISNQYWKSNYELVKEMMSQSEVYVFEVDKMIQGFVGLNDEYIEGIFVSDEMQSCGIEQMDEKPEDYSQEDDAGLDLIDFYVLPHYLTAPFKKVTEKIMTEFSDLNLSPINNRQGIVIDGEGSKVVCKD